MIDQNKRDKPKSYIDKALEIFKQRSGKTIVEIGSMRMSLFHSIDDNSHECCNDGHSSVLLCRACEKFYSVDITLETSNLTRNTLNILGFRHHNVINGDGLEFLESFEEPINLLFLDAWDVNVDGYAESHLEAYKLAKKNLHQKSLILIDDTDVIKINDELFLDDSGLKGKGLLVIPEAIKDGYSVVFSGRQVLLSKDI